MAELTAFLLSPAGAVMPGQLIQLDGGAQLATPVDMPGDSHVEDSW